MINKHLSEEELQLFAAGLPMAGTVQMQHIEVCASCREQIAAYQMIFSDIKEQPADKFDFDLAATVLNQLQPVKAKAPNKNFYAVIPVVSVAILVIVSLYIFRRNFLNLSSGISFSFLLLSLMACIVIIGIKIGKLYHRYHLQIKKLDYSA